MDKISGILPNTARINSVDVRESGPVRPGIPAFGRTEMPAEARPSRGEARVTETPASTAQKGSAVAQEMSDWRSKDMSRAALVSQMNDKFFGRPKQVATEEAGEPTPGRETLPVALPMPEAKASKPAGFKDDEMRALRDSLMEPVESFGAEEREGRFEMPRVKQPEGLYPKGSFIDRTA